MLKNKILSIIVASVILYLSLANSHTFDKIELGNIPDFDKFVHFMMYFGLMAAIIIENRKSIRDTRQLMITGLIPLFYGIVIEVIQGVFTTTRSGSVFDALADCAGIYAAVLIAGLIFRKHKSNAY